jgi:hypothetical protein
MELAELYKIAKQHLEGLSPLPNPDFRLEQAEFNEEEKVWEIVISYLVFNVNKPESPLGIISTKYPYYRIYKKVKINEEKEVIGFYMFEK